MVNKKIDYGLGKCVGMRLRTGRSPNHGPCGCKSHKYCELCNGPLCKKCYETYSRHKIRCGKEISV